MNEVEIGHCINKCVSVDSKIGKENGLQMLCNHSLRFSNYELKTLKK